MWEGRGRGKRAITHVVGLVPVLAKARRNSSWLPLGIALSVILLVMPAETIQALLIGIQPTRRLSHYDHDRRFRMIKARALLSTCLVQEQQSSKSPLFLILVTFPGSIIMNKAFLLMFRNQEVNIDAHAGSHCFIIYCFITFKGRFFSVRTYPPLKKGAYA